MTRVGDYTQNSLQHFLNNLKYKLGITRAHSVLSLLPKRARKAANN